MSVDLGDQEWRLVAGRESLLQELRRIKKVLGRASSGDALIRFSEGILRVRAAGAEFAIPAQGQWPGEVWVAASWLRALARVPPAGDPLVLHVAKNRIKIGGSSMECHFRAPGASSVEVSVGPDLPTLLRLGLLHGEKELANAGLLSSVLGARKELERRIAQAAKILAPYGVSDADVRILVIGKLEPRQ